MLKSLYWRAYFFLQNRTSKRFQRSLGHDVTGLIVDAKNGRFAVDPADLEVGAKLRLHGAYGMDEVERIAGLIDETSSVLVVGSHIGSLVIPIAKMCRKVVAVEANPRNYRLLETNIKLNDATNVEPHHVAASAKEEMIRFQMNTVNSGGSKRVPVHNRYIYTYDNPEVIEVQAYALDAYLDDHAFDLVLIDIEGSEYFAMQGMTSILGQTKTLIVEFLPHHITNVAGVVLDDFLAQVPEHFTKLTVPTKNATYDRGEGMDVLRRMFAAGEGDDGILFHH
ncbi:MAG: FkbM family methyltransferase [Candidatus Poseidoniaceae archaeon]